MKPKPEWMENPPNTLDEKITLIKAKSHYLQAKGSKGQFLRSLLRDVNRDWDAIQTTAKAKDPLAFFKPSYDQALILNAWMYGIQFVCVYTANRIGKTTILIIDKILWIFPNDPRWLNTGIFRAYQVGDPDLDPENHDNPRKGQLVEVFPRPPLEFIPKIAQLIKKHRLKPDPMLPHYHPINEKVLTKLRELLPEAYLPAFPYAPINHGGEIWVGAPDQKYHENIVMPLWQQYLPEHSIERTAYSDREMTLKIEGQKRTTYWEWVGKSYASTDTKWSGKAVEIIMLTEGVTPAIFKEVKVRFTDPGVGSHDFTPYEPSNQGPSEALAKGIKTGKEQMPLPTFVFEGFTVFDTPIHILPKNKREGLINAFKGTAEGQARLYGKFYSSSGLVLSNLSREVHLLPHSLSHILSIYPDARIYRGLDPGYDHPTACAWLLLLPTNQWIVYRIMAERGMDICNRCKRIITLSGNQIMRHRYGPRADQFYLVEAHNDPTTNEIASATIVDFHVFKKDEVTNQAYALNYITNGLSVIESTHMGPEDRAQQLDSLLVPSPFYPDLRKRFDNPHSPSETGGARIYFLQNGPGVMEWFLKMEDFYWERQRGGENKGQPKDKVPSHGDDELDAICYATCSNFRWTRTKPKPRLVQENEEPERHLIEVSEGQQHPNKDAQAMANDQTTNTPQFATVATVNSRRYPQAPVFPAVYFGKNPNDPATLENDLDDDEY